METVCHRCSLDLRPDEKDHNPFMCIGSLKQQRDDLLTAVRQIETAIGNVGMAAGVRNQKAQQILDSIVTKYSWVKL